MAKRSLGFNPDSPPPKSSKEKPISPSKLTTTDNHAIVSGLLSTLSPLQPNHYFHRELTDGDARIVGFDKAKLEKLKPYCNYQIPVTLKDCVIQRNKMKDSLELVLKSHTKIEKSTMSFEIPDLKTAGSFVITLDKLSTLADHTRVTIRAAVIKVHESQKVG